MTDGADLPDDVDPELWFWSERCDGRDYLFDSHWHTHPGRMAAFCPHDADHPDYRISKDELPEELPVTTRYFVAGFLAGNLPAPPCDDAPASEATMSEWERAAERFSRDGVWIVDVDLDEPRRQIEAEQRRDAGQLARIGQAIAPQVADRSVELPTELVEAALAASRRWYGVFQLEDTELAALRSATLVHIGMVAEQARPAGGWTTQRTMLTLGPQLIGEAIASIDDVWDARGIGAG
jgi:hypothetical protein